ncbi:unnamed protein product [Periconia digitata]|uniref:Uncharacterized protein n=1 Tax=Periconia digitata TaxID=1303443 RepID=A0A9W4UVF9_9PLEO|nr:unnamed protein product [Periconia digitata]
MYPLPPHPLILSSLPAALRNASNGTCTYIHTYIHTCLLTANVRYPDLDHARDETSPLLSDSPI